MKEKYYTITEIISFLKIGYSTLLRKIKNKEIGAIKVGRGWRVSESEAEKLKHNDNS